MGFPQALLLQGESLKDKFSSTTPIMKILVTIHTISSSGNYTNINDETLQYFRFVDGQCRFWAAERNLEVNWRDSYLWLALAWVIIILGYKLNHSLNPVMSLREKID